MMEKIPITVLEFKNFFRKEFDFVFIEDSDIELSFSEALAIFPYCLKIRSSHIGFLYLSAHLLFIRSGDGKGNKASLAKSSIGLINSEKLDKLSVDYALPSSFLKNKRYSFLLNSIFGIRYLQYLSSFSTQIMGIVRGRSQPD